jgi:hypothetical protein
VWLVAEKNKSWGDKKKREEKESWEEKTLRVADQRRKKMK